MNWFPPGSENCMEEDWPQEFPRWKKKTKSENQTRPDVWKGIKVEHSRTHRIFIYIYTPRTQMSLVLIGKDLFLEAKQRTNGFQVYIYISHCSIVNVEKIFESYSWSGFILGC